MKKFLLSLAVVLGIGSMSAAETTTLPSGAWSDYSWTKNAAGDWSATISGCEFNLEKAGSTSDYAGPASDLRIYQGSVLTITAPTGITFSNIEISIANGSKATTAIVSDGWTASGIANNKVTFTATTGQSSITFNGDKQLRIASMVVTSSAALSSDQKPAGEAKGTGTEADPYNATAALAIAKSLDENGSVEAYTYGTVKTVSIDTSYGNATYTITDGASNLSVYRGKYFNGDKFTSTDQLKEGDEVVVYGNLVNYKGNTPQYTTNSRIVKLTSKDAGEVATTEVANIAAFMELATGTKARITSPVTAIYQNGNYLYIQDNTGSTLVYGSVNKTFENGMTIAAGIEGTISEYNGLKQFATPVAETFAAGVAGTAIAPEAYAIEEISADIAYAYVSFEGVSIAAVEGNDRNFTMTDETGSITLYQQWSNVEIPVGENLNVVGFVGAYKGTAQILAVSITSASGKEIVAAPTFSPNGGAVLAGTEVTIASATEGATIYYTTDGTEPTTASTVYTEAIVVNEALTLKAIAVKEGLDNSAVATAEFTIKEPTAVSGNTATFNFTDPSTLDPAYSLADSEPDGTTGNNKIDLANGNLFTANGITISTNATGNPTRLYCQKAETDKTWSFRFFKNSVVTVSCQQGYKLTSIEFEPQTTNYASILSGTCTFSTGTLADNVLTFGTEATVTSVDITNPSNGATCGLKTMTVTFTEVNGISDVEIDENAPVEFFNLQGVRVNGDLTPGLYIRRQGNNATKVIVK